MRDLDPARARRDGGNHKPFGAEQVPADSRADNVRNRIDRADFVEVDFFDGRAVDLGLGLGQSPEDGQGGRLLLRRKPALVDNCLDVVQMPMFCSGSCSTVICVARKPCFFTSCPTSLTLGNPSEATAALRASSGTPASTTHEGHVAADTAGAIEVGNSHENGPGFGGTLLFLHA